MDGFDAALFVMALGLAVALEGALWSAFPGRMREAARALSEVAEGRLRSWGLCLLALGIAVCFAGRLLR